MPNKKSALSKPAAKSAPTAAKKAPPARREPAKKEPPKPAKSAKALKPAAPGKPALKAAAKPVAGKMAGKAPPAPAKPVKLSKPPQSKPAPAKPAAKAKPDPKAKAKASPPPKPEPKTASAKGKAEPKAPPAKAKEAKKPEPKAAKPEAKAEKPAKPPKPPKPQKPEKPQKLAPVAAALAKPMPAKPMAVAAGRAQPVARTLATPAPRAAPKPLTAPKPVAAESEQVGESQAIPAFKAKAAGNKGMVLVGAIAGAFGVKGEVRLNAITEKPEGIISYGPLYGDDGKVLLKPKSWRRIRDGVAVVTPEVKTKEQADKMRGTRLYVPRANLPPTAKDEYYVVDLLGSRAEALDGTILGDIVAVWNFGAGDILEYRPPNGGPNVRVTFTKETVPHVDLAAKRVVLDPPAPEPVGK